MKSAIPTEERTRTQRALERAARHLRREISSVPSGIPKDIQEAQEALREAEHNRDIVARILRERTGMTLVARMVRCGNPNCRCARDPASRHGPYLYTRTTVGGKERERYLPRDWRPAPSLISPEDFEALRELYFAWVRRVHKLRAHLESTSGKKLRG